MTGYGSYLRKRTAEYNERETNVLHDLNRTLHDGPLQTTLREKIMTGNA